MTSLNRVRDKNNVETGLWLPEDRRCYIDKYRILYVDKHGFIGMVIRNQHVLLNT